MKALSWVLLALGCYGALVCVIASGLLGAIFSGDLLLMPWDGGGQWAWWQRMTGTVAERWPWVVGTVLCVGFALLGAYLQMREPGRQEGGA